eukprot:9486305-Pyramimonas_sp.AAC.1
MALPVAGPPSHGGRRGRQRLGRYGRREVHAFGQVEMTRRDRAGTVMMLGDRCLEVTTSTRGYVATSSGVAELLALNRAGASAI